MVYSEKLSRKGKIQLYAMAAIFLILMYGSPSGLVFYWTLNNLFSLAKNIVYKFKPAKQEETAVHISDNNEQSRYWMYIVPGIFSTVLLGILIPLLIYT